MIVYRLMYSQNLFISAKILYYLSGCLYIFILIIYLYSKRRNKRENWINKQNLEIYNMSAWGRNKIDPNDVVNMCNQFLVVHLLKKVNTFQARGLSRNTIVYKNAISSIKRYPLPIICKAQLESINGIGQYLGQQLQKLIKKHYSAYLDKNLEQKFPQNQNISCVEEASQSMKMFSQGQGEDEQKMSENSLTTKSANIQYKPRVNTANAYFLQVLQGLTNNKSEFGATGVPKQLIQQQVQLKCPSAKNKMWKSIQQTLRQNAYIKVQTMQIQNSREQRVFYKLTTKGQIYAQALDEKDKNNQSKNKIISQVRSFKSQFNSKKIVAKSQSQCVQFSDEIKTQNQDYKLTSKNLVLQQKQMDSSEFYLVIDNRERNEKSQVHYFAQKISKKFGVQCKNASLSIGDFLWVYQNKVLDYVIERKKADDLAASILDGRYKDQKYRLKNCGVSNIFYIYEGYPSDNCNRPQKQLYNALLKTRIKQKFKVYQTKDVNETLKLLNTLHLQIYENVISNKAKYICDLDDFIEYNSVQRNSTVQRIFALGLMTIPGVGKNTINILIQYFKTYRTMHDYLIRFQSDEERVQFLKNLFKGTGMMTTLPKIIINLLFSQNYAYKKQQQKLAQRSPQSIRQVTTTQQATQNQYPFATRQRQFSVIREQQQNYEDEYNI